MSRRRWARVAPIARAQLVVMARAICLDRSCAAKSAPTTRCDEAAASMNPMATAAVSSAAIAAPACSMRKVIKTTRAMTAA